MKKNTITIIMAIVLTIITGAVAYYVSQKSNTSLKVSTVKKSPIKDTVKKDSINDTTAAKHTIVIENVDDPRQLQEILTLLESYSSKHEIQDLSITTSKDKILK